MHRTAWAGLLIATVLLAGCGDSSPDQAPGGEGAAQVGEGEGATVYDCFGVQGTAEEILEGPTLAEFEDHPGYDPFVADSGGDPAEWVVVTAEDDRLAAIREREEPEHLDGAVRTHERFEVAPLDGSNWMPTSAGPCALQALLPAGLGSASLELDPAQPPEPDDTEVALLATEMACASGRTADGRIVLVDLELTDDEVRVVVGVEPRAGDQECPSNPPTPVALELPEPLGERRIVDAAVLPPRPLEAGGS